MDASFPNQLLLKMYKTVLESDNDNVNSIFDGVCIHNLLIMLYEGLNTKNKIKYLPENFEEKYLDLKYNKMLHKSPNYKMFSCCLYQDCDLINEDYAKKVYTSLHGLFMHAPLNNLDINEINQNLKDKYNWSSDFITKKLFEKWLNSRIVLMSKVIFDGKWKIKFDPNDTTDKKFYVPQASDKYNSNDKNFVFIPMMSKKFISINTLEIKLGNLDCMVYKLDYDNNNNYMMIIIPKKLKPSTKKELSQEIIPNISNLTKILCQNKNIVEYDKVYIPKFHFKNRFDVGNIFEQIPELFPFNSNKVFNNITDRCKENPPQIIRTLMDVEIENNEYGTLVESMVVYDEDEYGPMKILLLDKPFVFGICNENRINTIGMFMGKK